MNDIKTTLTTETISAIIAQYPQTAEFLANYNLSHLAQNETIATAVKAIPKEELEEFGLTAEELIERLADFLTALYAKRETDDIRTVTIIGGQNKSGDKENIALTVSAGEIISIVGPTGSGKSRLLADIESSSFLSLRKTIISGWDPCEWRTDPPRYAPSTDSAATCARYPPVPKARGQTWWDA